MDATALTRMQIRVVRTVFRSESTRLGRLYPLDAGADACERLRVRSVELLDHAEDRLNGEGIEQPELLDELQSARDEVNRDAPLELSVGLSGDRRG